MFSCFNSDTMKKYILNEEWDILFVLDSCRYDYFKKYYPQFFKGTLTLTHSHNNNTETWHIKNFKGRDCSNIVYVTPIISFKRWLPDYNFHEVCMSWKDFWNDDYGTVLPESTTYLSLLMLEKYKHKNKRFIFHYLQPHIPYINIQPKFDKVIKSDLEAVVNGTKTPRSKPLHFLSTWLSKKNIPNHWQWKITKWFGIDSYVGSIYNNGGWNKIQQEYADTLRKTLQSLSVIVSENHDKKIVITSDHGELLGEKNLFGHCQQNMKEFDAVKHIPWFEVET